MKCLKFHIFSQISFQTKNKTYSPIKFALMAFNVSIFKEHKSFVNQFLPHLLFSPRMFSLIFQFKVPVKRSERFSIFVHHRNDETV
jgi:hypothetical protein